MRLADTSVRKKNPAPAAEERRYGSGRPHFCAAEEAAAALKARFPAGTFVFLTDERSFALSKLFPPRRTVTLVQETAEALPLFSMPDSTVCAVAAGSAPVFSAARYFAEVRRIPCVLFPSDARCEGIAISRGRVLLGGKAAEYPLRAAETYFDLSRMDGFPEAFARLLLVRLSCFEHAALRVFRKEEGEADARYEQLFAAAEKGISEDREVIVRAGIALGELGEEGLQGDGRALASLLAGRGEPFACFRAYRMLTALYRAFFRKGRPRRFFTPDYRARCERAGVGEAGYLRVRIPSAEEYAARAMALERARSRLLRDLGAITARDRDAERIFRLLGGDLQGAAPPLLSVLPEYAPEGLSAVIRDFGLLEAETGV